MARASFTVDVLLSLFLSSMVLVSGQDGDGGRKELVPAMFIFGDSLIDNGNNNDLPSFAKANYYPYGIDFNGGRPTGRFSNGLTMVDGIGQSVCLCVSASCNCLTDVCLRFLLFCSSTAGTTIDPAIFTSLR